MCSLSKACQSSGFIFKTELGIKGSTSPLGLPKTPFLVIIIFFNLKKHRVNSRNNAVVRRRGLICGTVLSVIHILPGGLESLLAAPLI